jgi:hypothetical protein
MSDLNSISKVCSGLRLLTISSLSRNALPFEFRTSTVERDALLIEEEA